MFKVNAYLLLNLSFLKVFHLLSWFIFYLPTVKKMLISVFIIEITTERKNKLKQEDRH